MIQPPYRTLSNGVIMPLLGLGVYDMYHREAETAVSSALEIGYRLIDTAPLYQNETQVGNAIRQSGIARSELFITTKVSNQDQGIESTLRAFDQSLKKLNTDYIDQYMIHWPIRQTRAASWLALCKLLELKRVRAVGVANYLVPFIEEMSAYSSQLPMVNQVEFTPWLFQRELLDYCVARNILLQSYSPLTRGIKLKDPRLKSLCQKYRRTPAQIILRWNLDHGISTIPKSSSRERLQENFSIFDFQLTREEIQELDGLNENFRICEDPISLY